MIRMENSEMVFWTLIYIYMKDQWHRPGHINPCAGDKFMRIFQTVEWDI